MIIVLSCTFKKIYVLVQRNVRYLLEKWLCNLRQYFIMKFGWCPHALMFCSSFKHIDVLNLPLFYFMPYQIKFHKFISRRKSFLSNTTIGNRAKEVEFPHWNQLPTCCVHYEPSMFNQAGMLGTAVEFTEDQSTTRCFNRLCSVFSFPVGGELLNFTNYQSLWLEAFLPDAENVKKANCLWIALTLYFLCDNSSYF